MNREQERLGILWWSALVVLLVWVATSLWGCASSWTNEERLALGAYAMASAADGVLTERGLSAGAVEINPAFGGQPDAWRLFLTKAAALGAVWWISERMEPGRARKALLWSLFGLQAGAVTWNATR